MIWALLALAGVPLWLCGTGIFVLVHRNRELRRRPGNLSVRRRLPGKKRWSRGHGVWAHDVFAFRGSPAAWKESLLAAVSLSRRTPTPEEQTTLRRLDDPVVVRITDDQGMTVDFAASAKTETALIGPFSSTAGASAPTSDRQSATTAPSHRNPNGA